jgi:phage terminase large subunit-like protein
MVLRDWQKQFILDVYAPLANGRRRVRRAIFSVARKNGKTALIAALVLAHLCGPVSEMNGEIYSAATDREQAGQVFKFARQIIEAEPEFGPGGSCPLTVVPSTKTILCKQNGSFYRALSAEAGTKHGLNPSLWIYDELAQARDHELYDVLNTSQGARNEPLGFVISTQSPDPEHPLSKLIDDGLRADDTRVCVHLYAADDNVEDLLDEDAWAAANPALGDFRKVEDIRALAEEAVRMPSREASFRNLYLNQRVDQTTPLISRSEWKACQDTDARACRAETGVLKKGERIYLGLDLSAKVDLTALVAVSAEPGSDRVKAWHWKPKDYLHDHYKRDHFDYPTMVKEGWLDAAPGKVIDFGHVAKAISRISQEYEIAGIAYDRSRIDLLLVEFSRLGIEAYKDGQDQPYDGAIRMVDWGQGFVSMAPAIDALEESVIQRRFVHDGNPVLGFCFANAIVQMDAAGNRKLNKAATRFRIDGSVATAMALGLKARDVVNGVPNLDDFVNNIISVTW